MRFASSLRALAILASVWPHAVSAVQIGSADTVRGITPTASNTYDYIVVGSGPGGGPLAARLARAGYSVLVLEAGEDHGTDAIVQIPLFQTFASEYDPINWRFFVSHHANSTLDQEDPSFTWKKPDGSFWVGPNPPAGSTPLGIYYPRASTLGGCAEHNAMVALYPSESDWKAIQTVTGDRSWAPSNMRKYWQRLENNQYLNPGSSAASGHGFNGWLDTSLTDLSLMLLDHRWISVLKGAATAMGVAFTDALFTTVPGLSSMMYADANNASPNRDTTPGLYQLPLSVTNTTRARASHRNLLLTTAGSRKYKLTLQMKSLVSKVMFDTSGRTPRAIGVQYLSGSNLYRASAGSGSASPTGTFYAYASREVILSAGTFNTPQILKLSGIGPRDELSALRINTIVNAPGVGTNMQDRYEVTVTGTLPTTFPIYENCTFLQTPTDACYQQWLTNPTSRGIYGTNGVSFGAFIQSSVSNENDIFVGGLPANFHGYFPGYSSAADLQTWSYLVLKAHTLNNAGTVKLASADPRDMPKISFNSFTVGADKDVQAVYEGVQLARAMFSQTVTADGRFVELNPGPDVKTEAQIKEWIKRTAWGHHASSSVPIGSSSDPNAVLDSNFKVRGVNGLRVVDASVFPKIPDFYIAGAVFVISEKAADAILGYSAV